MRADLRTKHDTGLGIAAMRLFDAGREPQSVASVFSVPKDAVRKWQQIYHTFGSETLLNVDGRRARYTYE